jgi:imidazole glycerol-phosphate synthase subunit HisF
MLKKRIIPVQLLLAERLVKTVRFDSYRDVGDPVQSSKVYSAQDADELVFLNINREKRSIAPLVGLLEKVSEVSFMPLSLGGGIRSLEDAEVLIKHGADKVVVNSACYADQDLVARIADKFGSQAVVVSIDARTDSAGGWRLYSDCGRKAESRSLEEHVRTVVASGAGEIFVNSIDRDGTMEGYDLGLIKAVMAHAGIPVIACGGAGHYNHMKEAFLETGASALACGSLFNFGDNNPIRAKAFLSNYHIPFKVI